MKKLKVAVFGWVQAKHHRQGHWSVAAMSEGMCTVRASGQHFEQLINWSNCLSAEGFYKDTFFVRTSNLKANIHIIPFQLVKNSYFKFLQGSVSTLFRWSWKILSYFVANLSKTLHISFCQNQSSIVEAMIKKFWCVFLMPHSVQPPAFLSASLFHYFVFISWLIIWLVTQWSFWAVSDVRKSRSDEWLFMSDHSGHLSKLQFVAVEFCSKMHFDMTGNRSRIRCSFFCNYVRWVFYVRAVELTR